MSQKSFTLSGVLPALVTPFDKEENLDEPAYRTLISHLIDQGVTGVVPMGTTGEFSNMTLEERQRAVEVCIDEVNGRVPVVAGIGDSATKHVIAGGLHAKDAGADAVIIVTPYYLKPGAKGLYEHYDTIASKLEMPIVLYNIPVCTGLNLPWQVVEDLADIDNIVAIKDSSGDMKYFMSLLEKVGDTLSVMIGWDELVQPALAAGAHGMILASANVIPDMWLQVYDHMKEGRIEEAIAIQRQVQKFTRIIVASGALGTKCCVNDMGVIPSARCRKPLMLGDTLSYEFRDELRVELEKFGKIEKKAITFEFSKEERLDSRFFSVGLTPETISGFDLRIGEALVGDGNEVAHIDILIGKRDGPVGEAYARALSNPVKGYEVLQVILEPNMVVKPSTIMVPTVRNQSLRHSSLVYGPAQAAIGKAIMDSVESGILPEVDDLLMIANVFVHPSASRRKRIHINNYKAMRNAIRHAMEGTPTVADALEHARSARHPFRDEI